MNEPTPEELDVKIGKQIARRDKLREMVLWIEERIQYRNDRIAALSKQRTISLNLKLNLVP